MAIVFTFINCDVAIFPSDDGGDDNESVSIYPIDSSEKPIPVSTHHPAEEN